MDCPIRDLQGVNGFAVSVMYKGKSTHHPIIRKKPGGVFKVAKLTSTLFLDHLSRISQLLSPHTRRVVRDVRSALLVLFIYI